MASSLKGLFFICCQSIAFPFACGKEMRYVIKNNMITDCIGQSFIIVPVFL